MSSVGSAGPYELLRGGAGAAYWERDVVRVWGPDATQYLQGQTSQDVAQLGPGAWAWALVLQPQGKLDAFVRVYCAAADDYYLDTDPGMAAHLVARLMRFRLRTKAEIEPVNWRFIAVRGVSAPPPPPTGPDAPGGTVIGFEWGGLAGYDLAGPEPQWPAGMAEVDAQVHDVCLLEAGFPRHGAELDERTIPAEAGLVDGSVSFTKGCYTGQELVARLDARGNNVPRRLWGLVGDEPVSAGDELFSAPPGDSDETKPVGRVTSSAVSPRRGPVALGYLARSTGAGAEVWAVAGAGRAAVALGVVALPL